VETLAGGQHQLSVGEALQELVSPWEFERLPNLAGRLALDPGAVGEQAAKREVAEARFGNVPLDLVVQLQPSLVSKGQHGGRGEGFRDRADAVLRLGRRLAAPIVRDATVSAQTASSPR
jgi:hypothetical protein